jgi:nucleoside-diphosphate-sugar epimerase
MKILVIGGTNFIGPPVVRRLKAMGNEVTVFHRGTTKPDLPEGVNYIKGDRKNLAAYQSQFAKIAPQVVLDMIAYTEQDARDLVNTFKGICGRIVAISSQDVYRAYNVLLRREAGIESIPLKEDSALRTQLYPFRDLPERPLNCPADYDKILVERVVMGEPDLPGTILRLPMVYGSGDPLNRLFPYIKRMDEKRPVIVLEENIANWCGCWGYVENVAEAIALCVTNEQAAGKIYNVAEISIVSEAERIRNIGRIAGWHGQVIIAPKSKMPESWSLIFNTEQHWVTDTTRIRQELDYSEPVPPEEALQQTIDWQRNHPPEDTSKWVAPELLDYANEDAILASSK